MDQLKNLINPIIDELIIKINSTFIELLAANLMHELGINSIDNIDNRSVISPKVGIDLNIEPIPIIFIKNFKDNYPDFLLEVFHGKFVNLWNDLLSKLFTVFIDLHFSSIRKFEELKKQGIKIDFSSGDELINQIKSNIIEDYNFKEFSERNKLINKILNPHNEGKKELLNIHKNILIRNAIQHRKNLVTNYISQRLGRSHVELLDNGGKLVVYNEGDVIRLSIPEIYAFKKSILNIAQIWRIING